MTQTTTPPRERPILFSGSMVRALLAGTKTQTRRVVKITHRTPGLASCLEPPVGLKVRTALAAELCPHGKPGDRLWVRETYFAFGRWETRYSAKKKRDEWHFVDLTLDSGQTYLADEAGALNSPLGRRAAGALPTWHKRPAIFMPRAASRIQLEIADVRVERLQDISEADANAEGSPHSLHLPGGRFASENFAHLWWTINGEGSWEANPWVWAISFRRLTP